MFKPVDPHYSLLFQSELRSRGLMYIVDSEVLDVVEILLRAIPISKVPNLVQRIWEILSVLTLEIVLQLLIVL